MKKKLAKLLLFFFLLFSLHAAQAAELTISKSEAIQFVDAIHEVFASHYAPSEWKRNYCQWSLEGEIANMKHDISQSNQLTIRHFHQILNRFFNSAKDYHVGINFFSTEEASLPFEVKGVDGNYYITAIDKDALDPNAFLVEVGDKLILFDGKDPQLIINDLKEKHTNKANEETDCSLAERMLTFRLGALGMDVPRGPISIMVQKKGSEDLQSYQLIWSYTPEKITNLAIASDQQSVEPPIRFASIMNRALPSTVFGKKSKEIKHPSSYVNPNDIGNKISFLPHLGEVIWEADEEEPFQAYIYQTSTEKTIGFVRIQQYMLDYKTVLSFHNLIAFFQENCDALVIDQLNNPGGSLFALCSLASVLSDSPLALPKEQVQLSQNNVFDAATTLPFLEEAVLNIEGVHTLSQMFEEITYCRLNIQMLQFWIEYYRFILDEWNNGHFLTELTHLFFYDHVNPHPTIRFTKPILILINGLDFSCGDFFPAIMQDNKRAILLGSKTAGAGGFVQQYNIPNRLGVRAFTITGSLAQRQNGQPIENLGVEPDIPYELTKEDLTENYKGFIDTINQVVEGLTQ